MNRIQKDELARKDFFESFWDDKPVLELPVENLTRSQWETLRGGFLAVGGSDIGALMGFSEYLTAKDLFYRKLGITNKNFVDNKYAFMGRFLEDEVGRLWESWEGTFEKTMENHDAGVTTRKRESRGMLIDPDMPGIVANIDGAITEHPVFSGTGILEIKTMTSHSRAKYENGINPGHIFQVNGYMLVSGAKYGEIAILEAGTDFEVYTITPSPIIQEAIFEAATTFRKNLLKGAQILQEERSAQKVYQYLSELEPPAEPNELLSKFYTEKRKVMELNKRTMGSSEEFQNWVIERQRKHDQWKQCKDDMGVLDAKIKQWMDEQMVTQVDLDEGYVRFYDRLYFHPKIKKELL